jgi:phosphotransferase system  glucose/maltose/N-acetylglucosamine-specific IIC component
MNNVKVFTLLAGMTVVMGMVGQAMGGQSGMLIALLIAGLMNFYMYFTSSTKVMKAFKAQTITREQDSSNQTHLQPGAMPSMPSSVSPRGCLTCLTRMNCRP